MTYDTAGNTIKEPRVNCNCGLTGGCEKCNGRESFIGMLEPGEADIMTEKVAAFKEKFNDDLEKRHKELFPIKE